jgi:hypothetical protein
MINDFCILAYAMFSNIYGQKNATLISNDGDMSMLAEIFMNKVVPGFFAEKIIQQIESEGGKIDVLIPIIPGNIKSHNIHSYYRELAEAKIKKYIQSLHVNPLSSDIKRKTILVVINLKESTIKELNIIEPLRDFLRFDQATVEAKTSVIRYSIEN